LPSFIAQFVLVTGGYPIYLLTYLYYYPGANFALAFLLGFLPMLALLGVYALFGISMPRTGGDYIYVSRGLNSIAGFINSFAMASAYMVSAGIYLAFAALYFIYQFTSLGIIYKNVEIIKMGSRGSAITRTVGSTQPLGSTPILPYPRVMIILI